jgi:ribonucleoside-diphosphate reductase alpha chain
MDCDTTGIEPDIALVKYKQLAGGGMLKIVNNTVPLALKKLGYDDAQVQAMVKHIDECDTIEGAPHLQQQHLPVFDCAFKPANGVRSIGWQAHVRMMAAAQPFISGAISKTVNMPNDVTPQDIADAYSWGWKVGLKALAIYRDGSKMSQPLNTKSDSESSGAKSGAEREKAEREKAEREKAEREKAAVKPRRERLPDTRQSMTHKFSVAGHDGYITVGLYPDGRPGELFITMAKEGSTVGGLMDAFGTAISISLQYGVPLEALVNKFSHMRFEPMGHTTNPDIRIAKSLVDYIFRWLGITFLPGFRESIGLAPKAGLDEPVAEQTAAPGTSKPQNSAAGKSATAVNGNGATSLLSAHTLIGRGVDALEIPSRDRFGPGVRDEQFAKFQSDAPTCDNCGAITVRNGNCYLCHNCGNSMGCS